MNKKAYQKPAMQVVNINSRQQLLSGSPVSSVSGNAGFDYGGGGSGRARTRGDWDDEE